MKSLFFLSTALLLTSTTIYAKSTPAFLQSEINTDKKDEAILKKQKREDRRELKLLKGDEVSHPTMNEFIHDFGDIPVTSWERLDNFDEATFTKDGKLMSAFYDDDSKLVGTTQSKTFAALPEKAQQFINHKYKAYTPGDVLFFDDNEMNETDMVLYGNSFAGADSYFVELQQDNKKIVLHVDMDGDVKYFTRLS